MTHLSWKFVIQNLWGSITFGYNDLADIGEFKSFVFLSDILNKGDRSSYMYGFTDVNGAELSLYVYENGYEDSTEKEFNVTTDADGNDLRKISAQSRSIYSVGGFQYRYVSGILSSIKWSNGGTVFVLGGSLCDYPIEKADTVVGKLLTSQTDALSIYGIFDVIEDE